MHRVRFRRALPISATILAIALSLFAFAERPDNARAVSPNITIAPVAQSVSSGNVTVNVMVEDAPEFGAYEFHLSFAPNVLGFVSVENGSFLGSTGRDPFCVGPNAEHLAAGVISYACGSLGVGAGPSGAGLLATVTFSTSCAGTSPINFTGSAGPGEVFDPANLSDVLGASIPVDATGGSRTRTSGSPCPSSGVGDANCNGDVDAIDAALMLQFSAGLLGQLQCAAGADVNGDGRVDAIDAALVLQYGAGLLAQLPP